MGEAVGPSTPPVLTATTLVWLNLDLSALVWLPLPRVSKLKMWKYQIISRLFDLDVIYFHILAWILYFINYQYFILHDCGRPKQYGDARSFPRLEGCFLEEIATCNTVHTQLSMVPRRHTVYFSRALGREIVIDYSKVPLRQWLLHPCLKPKTPYLKKKKKGNRRIFFALLLS